MRQRFANLLIDTADRLATTRNGAESWEAIDQIAKTIGATGVTAGGFLVNSPIPIWGRSTMDPRLWDVYMQANLMEIDPVIVGMGTGTLPQVFEAGHRLPGMSPDPRAPMLQEELNKFRYIHYTTHVWREGLVNKVLIMTSDRSPTDLFGPGTSQAIRAISAMLGTALTAPDEDDRAGDFGGFNPTFSPFERDTLCYLAHNLHPEEIARRLNSDIHTINRELKNAQAKMRATSTEQALALAMARGLLDV